MIAKPAKRVRLPSHTGNSSSLSSTPKPRPRSLGSPRHYALDNNSTTAVTRNRGSQGFSVADLLAAEGLNTSGARSSQPLSQKTVSITVSSGQSPGAEVYSSLLSSFLPDSTFPVTSSTNTTSLSTQDIIPLHTSNKQGCADLPKTLSRYKRKLKKFIGQ